MTTQNLIEIKSLHKYFGKNEVLKGLDIQIKRGEVVVMIGPSGSGKSTFLRTMNLLETPTKGDVFFEGTNIADKSVDVFKHREKMGMVFQQFNLFPNMTVLDNLTLAPVTTGKLSKEEAVEVAIELLAKVGLSEKAEAYPQSLSGGQQQRVAVARAIITRPEILLADEPTGALDSKSSATLLDIFEQINQQGQTILMVTHSTAAASRAKRVLFIKDGILYNQIYRGERTSQEMFQLISDTLTLMANRGE